ncbi:MAG: dihydropteroate synthase [Clostridia bacterium]|nr:dihydropteroate synthase [Clostridia bacterium]
MKEFICGKYTLPLGKKTYIMGILNVTPDSFSDGGKYNDVRRALEHTEKMIEDGADIIDIGAVSTKPFSVSVSDKEEWERLKPVLREIRKNFNVPVSVDTVSSVTAEKSLYLGADIINDVSGIFSSDMAEIIKKYNAGWVIMHGGVGVHKAQDVVDFNGGIINSVNEFFEKMLEDISMFGIPLNRICLDAGFGFAKTNEQNIELLKNFEKLNNPSLPLLCALSRKRFIGKISGEEDSSDRLGGTLAANITAVIKGADIIRVHEIPLHKKSIDTIDNIYR